MLKCDFHLHTSSDKRDEDILYSDEQLIDEAARQQFDVLALTFHDQCYFPKKIVTYAKKKGILLIPGIEKTVEGKHVLLLNYPPEDARTIETLHTFAALRHYLKSLKTAEREALLTVFAHPRFWIMGMGRMHFRKNVDVCDALEYQSFRHTLYDFNEDVKRLAHKYNKALVGNSDCHLLSQFNHTYTSIPSKKDAKDIIAAIKKGKATVISKPLSTKILVDRIRRDLNI